MLSAEEFKNTLKDIRNNGNTDMVGQLDSSSDTVKLVEGGNSKDDDLKWFGINLDKYVGDSFTDEQIRDILAGIQFVSPYLRMSLIHSLQVRHLRRISIQNSLIGLLTMLTNTYGITIR